MDSITAFARRFGLSRSTLLYYDRIGLLRAAGRSPAGYRRYGEADAKRLEAIRLYRDAGLPLAAIARLLDAPPAGTAIRSALAAHLQVLDRQAKELKAQQRRILRLLDAPDLPAEPLISAEALARTLRAAGFADADLDRLHTLFEHWAPDAHQAFLTALGLSPEAIGHRREAARLAGLSGLVPPSAPTSPKAPA
jgi:MerR family transcriptional regulator, thiopeptide resistance regulator